jgi:hypothetical protein
MNESFYELYELDRDDLKLRSDTIHTMLLQRTKHSGNFFGKVILRTPGIWWLFGVETNGRHNNALKVTRNSIEIVPVPEYWREYWYQYWGQAGSYGDEMPIVIESDKPFIRYHYTTSVVDGLGTVSHSVYTMARLMNAETAKVEIIGVGIAVDSQLDRCHPISGAVVDDMDGDGVHEMLINHTYLRKGDTFYTYATSLYLSSQRPVLGVGENVNDQFDRFVVLDLGNAWRVVGAASCLDALTPLMIYDIRGACQHASPPRVDGEDVLVDKPPSRSPTTLWVRIGACLVRLQ